MQRALETADTKKLYKVIIDAKGLEKLVQSFQQGLPQAISEGLDEVAEAAADGARQDVPVDTGALRDSIEIGGKTQNSIEVGASEEYAPYVEFGTSTNLPQPFLGPQADRLGSEAQRMMLDALKRHVSP